MATKKRGDEVEKLPPVLTVKRAAEVAGRSRRTIRRWAAEGLIKSDRPFDGRGSALLYIHTRSLLRLIAPGLEG